jgi:CDP-diacylglycerol--serine O-phosphatidyltransferase
MKSDRQKILARRRFDKRILPNIFTAFNMFLGFTAISLLFKGDPVNAAWLILIAAGMDVIDGKLARLFGISNRFGTEFDSFADTVSFCMAPAVLVYTTWATGLPPFLAGLISFIPILFGTIRLARFNIISENNPQSFFIGLTTPLNTLAIFGFLLFNYQIFGSYGDPRIAIPLMLITSLLMISPVRFGKIPLLSLKKGRKNNLRLTGFLMTFFMVIIWRGIVLFPLIVGYIGWSIMVWIIHHNRFEESDAFSSIQKRRG